MKNEVINELKEFDSLHNEWKVIASARTDEAYETAISAKEGDVDGFERVVWQKVNDKWKNVYSIEDKDFSTDIR